MSLEFELQKYPKAIKLKDGSSCRLRPLKKEDEKAFHKFFLAVPEPERMFIKHRVTEPEVIREWCQQIDLGRNLPLLALMDNKIVGAATLHQQLGGWKRHVGRVSVLVLPQYRGRGLARGLVSEIVALARGDRSWTSQGINHTVDGEPAMPLEIDAVSRAAVDETPFEQA